MKRKLKAITGLFLLIVGWMVGWAAFSLSTALGASLAFQLLGDPAWPEWACAGEGLSRMCIGPNQMWMFAGAVIGLIPLWSTTRLIRRFKIGTRFRTAFSGDKAQS